jgi:hypothetical protein
LSFFDETSLSLHGDNQRLVLEAAGVHHESLHAGTCTFIAREVRDIARDIPARWPSIKRTQGYSLDVPIAAWPFLIRKTGAS